MTWKLENVRRIWNKVKNIHLASAAGSRTIRNYTENAVTEVSSDRLNKVLGI